MNTWKNIALISIATLIAFIFYFFYPNIFGSRSHRSTTIITDGNPVTNNNRTVGYVGPKCYSRSAMGGEALFTFYGTTSMPQNTTTGENLQIIVDVIDLVTNKKLDVNQFSFEVRYKDPTDQTIQIGQESSIPKPGSKLNSSNLPYQRILDLQSNDYSVRFGYAQSIFELDFKHNLSSIINKKYRIRFYHDHGGTDHNIRDFDYETCPITIDLVKDDQDARRQLDVNIDDLFGDDLDTPIGVVYDRDRILLFNKNNPIAVPIEVIEPE